jgi:hypothetical protein
MNERMRPQLRDNHADADKTRPKQERDSVLEAEEYARALMEAGLNDEHEVGDFYIDPSIQPDGWSYEYKRTSVAGKEDGFYQADLHRRGWRPVPVSRHPELMPMGWKGTTIEKKGLMLMEWPTVLVKRAHLRDKMSAQEAVETADRRLFDTPAKTLPRDEFPKAQRGVRKTFEPAEPV